MPDVLALLAIAFWLVMIVDCVRNEPDQTTWLWVLLLLNVTGSVLYFLARKLPRLQIPLPSYFKRWQLRQQLWIAEANARNIGKAHQFIGLGNLLAEVGKVNPAIDAYREALRQEPNNVHAHWEMAAISLQIKQPIVAQTHLTLLLQHDPDYKCGEASLLLGKVLFDLGDWDMAQKHLERDLKAWSHPEAALMLAKILIAQGDTTTAQTHLQTLLLNLRASPPYHYRRHQAVVKQAERLAKSTAARS